MDTANLTLAAARQMLDRRELSASELTDFFLERIARLDPLLDAFILITAESAREQAQHADAEMARGVRRGALHGIPLALKDLFDVGGLPTTAGSKIFRDTIATQDAHVVTRLRDAGAVLLGKTNLHEIAYGVTNDNPHFGRAKNPWARDHLTGGSSGGSAVAVAARLCLGALGSDTGGSIRIPSALCGTTGIKPTYGRVSLRGVFPLSWSNDHVGPLAQTAQDCALLLQAIAGFDPYDAASADAPAPVFSELLNRPVRGLRFALPRGWFAQEVDDEVLRAVHEAARIFEESGATRVDRELPAAQEMFQVNRTTLRAEAFAYHEETIRTRAKEYGPDILTRLRSNAQISTADYARARRRQAELTRDLELFFADVDFILTPTTRLAAPPADADPVAMANHLTAFTAPFNVTGFPALSLPCGFTRDGLPIGLQIVGRKWQEDLILRAAQQYQLVTDWHARLPPS